MKEHIAKKQANELISISHILILMALVIQISGCGGHVYHIVEPGETLYSIGFLYGHDYRQVAEWNKIPAPYVLRKGQRLRVAPLSAERKLSDRSGHEKARTPSRETNKKQVAARDNTIKVAPVTDKSRNRPVSLPQRQKEAQRTVRWNWPVKDAQLAQRFNANDPAKRGIVLVGRDGQPIYSAAAGRVVYSGQGLPRYGKLVIVMHNDEYLSAYAHNRQLRVKQGDEIQAGQHIADMGRNNANKVLLHFEIRRNGKPVDPLKYLSKRK